MKWINLLGEADRWFWGMFCFTLVAIVASGYVTWRNRKEKDGEWVAGIAGLVSSGALLLIGTAQGLIAIDDKLASANDIGQLKTTIEEIQPKPFRTRLWAILDGIDPTVRQRVDDGQQVFKLTLNAAQLAALQSLAAEDDGSKTIILDEIPIQIFGNGMRYQAQLTVFADLLARLPE